MSKNIKTSEPASERYAHEYQQKNRPDEKIILIPGDRRWFLTKEADRHTVSPSPRLAR
jgi:hypothetical protein